MQNEFQPIYIWAQKLEDKPENDFYAITSSELIEMRDTPEIQRIAHEMGILNRTQSKIDQIFIDNIKKFFLKTLNSENLTIKRVKRKVLLRFKTTDRDIKNRFSNIDVFLDLTNVNHSNRRAYVEHFYQGFKQFCEVTNRHPIDLELIHSDDRFKNSLIDFRKPVWLTITVTILLIITFSNASSN